ncbi:MAG: sulfide/dihydroorotate dehydrogenase-like FAD/NAD-binding protein [Clostridia bacterium]|nr:sulfide/dihydroorotate dehydrogenase-like FAD/NAD-binding protein [Clostridia bacterium]
MYRIVSKKVLNPTVIMMDIEAPLVAKRAEAGQFIIIRPMETSERIPLTVAGFDREKGTVKIIFQTVGATTLMLSQLNEGDCVSDFAGPLGKPCETEGKSDVLVVGGGVGCAIALPIAEKLKEEGASVRSVIGFRTKDLIILKDEFEAVSDTLDVMTDDGSFGEMGNVCVPFERMIKEGRAPGHVIAIGPLVMMKFVAKMAKENGIPCTVSMNPIMIDGTGMCGGCRITLVKDGKRVSAFACVDGPDFDGWEVDFDEAMMRSGAYSDFERHKYEEGCNLFKKETKNG